MTETKAQQECPYCHDSKIIVGDSDLQANVMIHRQGLGALHAREATGGKQ